jgi:glucose/arabinose dehydrogenase
MRMRFVVMLVVAGIAGRAQQPAPAQGGARRAPTAPPPIIWPSPPLADGPIVFDTGIQHQIRLIVTKGLNQPWSMAFLPDGNILVTERAGRLRIVRNGVLDPNPIAGVPAVPSRRQARRARAAQLQARQEPSHWRADAGTEQRWLKFATSSPPFQTRTRRGSSSAGMAWFI